MSSGVIGCSSLGKETVMSLPIFVLINLEGANANPATANSITNLFIFLVNDNGPLFIFGAPKGDIFTAKLNFISCYGRTLAVNYAFQM